MKKIFIIGVAGSGKSTLARQLSFLLDIPSFEMDDILWIKKYTKKRTDKVCLSRFKKLLFKNKNWIIEGSFDCGKLTARKSDLIIWLNYGIGISTYRVIRRWLIPKREARGSIKELFKKIKCIRKCKKIKTNETSSVFEQHAKIISVNEYKSIEIQNKKELKDFLKEMESRPTI